MRKGLSFLKFTLITVFCLPPALAAQPFPFTWDQATVYSTVGTGSTEGRDFTAVRRTISSGYFDTLGINVLLLPAPFDRYYGGNTASGSVAVQTIIDGDSARADSIPGTQHEFREMVDAAHERGIRIVIKVGFHSMDSTSVDGVLNRLTAPVLQFGVDGFSVESAGGMSSNVTEALKEGGTQALNAWKNRNPDKVIDDARFWMTGEGINSGLVRGTEYDHGFDSLVNTNFQISIANGRSLDSLYSAYSLAINSDPSFNVLSYLLSGSPGVLGGISAQVALLLVPGAVQILSGQESEQQEVWRMVASFRKRHPSISAGAHTRLSETPYAFHRRAKISGRVDEVIVVLGASGRLSLNVSRVVPDDTVLRDVVTGNIGIVSFGRLSMYPGKDGMMLLEIVQ